MFFENLATNSIFCLLFGTVIFIFGGSWNLTNPQSFSDNSDSIKNSSNPATEIASGVFRFLNPVFSVSCATILLSLSLLDRWIQAGHPPLSNLYESLLFLTWSLLMFYLVSEVQSQETSKSPAIGMIVLSAALFTYTFATWRLPSEMQQITPLVPALQSNWLLMHVSIMLLSYAALIGGSLVSLTYLVVQKVAVPKISNESTIEPSVAIQELLLNLDNFSYRSLAFAFPMLTLGIISGAVWANEAWGSYWSWDPKETWALITWLIFAIYLHVRINKGWTGERAASVATIGFFMVWVCYLGVNLLGKGLHSYGWWN